MDDILESLNMVGMYMATVIAGLLIHAIIIIPVLYLIVVHKNPLRYFLGLRDAIITAFGTSSRCVRVGNREPNVSFLSQCVATPRRDQYVTSPHNVCIFSCK